ncbi:MAG TPA: ribosome biogenesis GTP-binding protein YihA/YsxC [Chlamydiales bacterium]|nr:ribosome biogenesis GTP-binding protein YihA/YsxC [Chlamydiales bacterium]
MIKFQKASFKKCVGSPEKFPEFFHGNGIPFPEIAIIGRSNVGKSSFINHLFLNKTLAKTSSSPGKTQTINFFDCDHQFILVDLPGYGYAKVNQKTKKNWHNLIDAYLNNSSHLKCALQLIDSRHLPTKDDLQFIQWAKANQIPLFFILTKTDKLSTKEKQQILPQIISILEEHYTPSIPYITYSIKDQNQRKPFIQTFNQFWEHIS